MIKFTGLKIFRAEKTSCVGLKIFIPGEPIFPPRVNTLISGLSVFKLSSTEQNDDCNHPVLSINFYSWKLPRPCLTKHPVSSSEAFHWNILGIRRLMFGRRNTFRRNGYREMMSLKFKSNSLGAYGETTFGWIYLLQGIQIVNYLWHKQCVTNEKLCVCASLWLHSFAEDNFWLFCQLTARNIWW